MSHEIGLAWTPGATLYAIVRTATGRYALGTTPEAFDAAHWASYAIALAELATGSGQYAGDFPALPAGIYAVDVYAQAGSSPAPSDGPPLATGQMQWGGTAEVPAFDPAAIVPVRNQDAVTAPTYADALLGAWCEAFGAEAEDDLGATYVKQKPDRSGPVRSFTLAEDSDGDPVGRS